MSGIVEHLQKSGWTDGEIVVDIRKSFVCAPLNGKTIFIAFVSYQDIWYYIVASYLERDNQIDVQDDLRLLTPEEIESLRNRGIII